MTKHCPECGAQVPDEAHFCADCGHDFFNKAPVSKSSDSIFTNGKIFLVLIVVVVIIGAVVILNSGFGGNDSTAEADAVKESPVDLTITEVSGYDGYNSGKKYYTLYTYAIFNKVPSDLKGYNIKTTYVDENGSEIGYEIEKLDYVYYDSDYALSFGHYDTYKKPNPDHVNVEIINGGKTVDNYTSKIDKSKIDFLN